MKLRFSANAGFFGLRRDRFTQYQPQRSLEERIALIAGIEGITGVELKYPKDFEDPNRVRALLDQHRLSLSAVNVDLKDATHFRHGALSARSAETRARAAALLSEAMDVAAECRCGLVTSCPLADGYDYPFQMDYAAAWDNYANTVREAAKHRSDITIVLEYQPHEPHSHILLGNAGRIMHLCAEVDVPNLGANLDVGHALAAGESPAEVAVLLHRRGLLRYVHYNDNTGDGGDWDMISGTVHFWHWLEFLYTLDRLSYDGWLSGDIASKHIGPVAAYRTNIRMIQRLTRLLERAGVANIRELVDKEGGFLEVYDALTAELAGGP